MRSEGGREEGVKVSLKDGRGREGEREGGREGKRERKRQRRRRRRKEKEKCILSTRGIYPFLLSFFLSFFPSG